MTTKELLIKRYKVESPFPTMERYNIKVGDILTDDGVNAVRNQNYDAIFAFEWESFPLIFRELFWYEERDVNDMPEYVIMNHQNKTVYKVKQHCISATHGLGFLTEDNKTKSYCNYFPATETDFLTYINTTQR